MKFHRKNNCHKDNYFKVILKINQPCYKTLQRPRQASNIYEHACPLFKTNDPAVHSTLWQDGLLKKMQNQITFWEEKTYLILYVLEDLINPSLRISFVRLDPDAHFFSSSDHVCEKQRLRVLSEFVCFFNHDLQVRERIS